MAEQHVVDDRDRCAAASAVMSEIADLEAYPEWTGSVRSVEVLSRGRRRTSDPATFVLDAGVIKDTYTLEYTWQGDD